MRRKRRRGKTTMTMTATTVVMVAPWSLDPCALNETLKRRVTTSPTETFANVTSSSVLTMPCTEQYKRRCACKRMLVSCFVCVCVCVTNSGAMLITRTLACTHTRRIPPHTHRFTPRECNRCANNGVGANAICKRRISGVAHIKWRLSTKG